MAIGKLSQILPVLYSEIETLVPYYEPSKGFLRWDREEDLSLTDPGQTFRRFRIAVLSVGRGSLHDQRYKQSRKAVLQVLVNYPASYQIADDADFLGVDAMRADDGHLMEEVLGGKRPDALQAVLSVGAPQWQGSFLVGRMWAINFSVEYMEDTT